MKYKIGDRNGVIQIVGDGFRRGLQKVYPVKCDCGNEFEMREGNFKHSLGVACIMCRGDKQKINQEHRGRLRGIWRKMKDRCYNEKDKAYQRYGGRWIKICDEWIENFDAFYNWAITNGYQDNLSIDRINNDGNYEPQNCRWATAEEQANNTRSNVYVVYKGERQLLHKLLKKHNIPNGTFQDRIKKGMSIEEAILTPIRGMLSKAKKPIIANLKGLVEISELPKESIATFVGMEKLTKMAETLSSWGIYLADLKMKKTTISNDPKNRNASQVSSFIIGPVTINIYILD